MVDLIRFVGRFYDKHHNMVDARDSAAWEEAFAEGYAEVRRLYPALFWV
jgi:hypothetical protein